MFVRVIERTKEAVWSIGLADKHRGVVRSSMVMELKGERFVICEEGTIGMCKSLINYSSI